VRSFTVIPTPDELAARAAAIVAERVRGAPRTRLVLAGGTSPKRCYALLSDMELPWGRVTILFGDERCVPPWHEDSNYRMAAETLLHKAHPATVHRMPAELGPEEGAKAYDPIVAAARLDLVLLGIGPDGHTASLFPGNAALNSQGCAVGVHGAPKPPPERVSLTLRALREAERVLVLVSGADKVEAVRKAKAGTVPAGMIEHAEWLVARESAG
jgi:6-phosphogluconolactonase